MHHRAARRRTPAVADRPHCVAVTMQRRSSSTASGTPSTVTPLGSLAPPGSMPSAARPLTGRSRVVAPAVSSAPSTANSPGPVRARHAAPSVRTVYVRLPSRRLARTCGPGPPGGAGHQHAGSPVDGVLCGGAAACTGVGREYHRVGPGQQLCDITGRGCLQVADGSSGADLVHIGGVGRVPDQPCGLVAALSQQALQQERDLPVPARDHYARAASLLTGITGRRDADASGPAPIGKGLLAHRTPGSRAGLQGDLGIKQTIGH